MNKIEDNFKNSNLPKGLQITPGKFIVLNKFNPKGIIIIDNLTWTTFAVYIKVPKWLNCEKKFMLEAKSNAEFEIFCNLDKKLSKTSLNDKIKFIFIDMSNKDTIYSTKLLVEYTNYTNQNIRETEPELAKSVFLLQLSIMFLILSTILLLYHYNFQEKYYLCMFQSTLYELYKTESSLPWLRKLFRC